MRVKQLIEFLQTVDSNLEVLETRYSDLGPMSLDDWSVIEAVPVNNGEWYTKTDYRAKNKELIKFLHYGGN